MEKQLTAVKWLVEEMINQMGIRIENTTIGCELFEQAKQLEKQQIIDAYRVAKYNTFDLVINGENTTAEQYYNNNFKQ